MPQNATVPFFKPGQDPTGYPTAPVLCKTLVGSVDGGRGGLTYIATAPAGGPALGVPGHDADEGQEVHVHVGGIVPILAAADIVAGTQVEVGAAGRIVPRTTGVAVGYATASGASGSAVPVKLYG